jgi:hypothetical protein
LKTQLKKLFLFFNIVGTIFILGFTPVIPGESNASQYDIGVMQQVIRNRRSMGQLNTNLEEYDGYVAFWDQESIGETIYLKPEGYTRYEKFLIVDCCSWIDGSCNWMRRNNIIVEIDAHTRIRWEKYFNSDFYLRLVKINYLLEGEQNIEGLLREEKMPKPRKNEGKEEFISRCISYVKKEDDKKDWSQKRVQAYCYQIWEDSERAASKELFHRLRQYNLLGR